MKTVLEKGELNKKEEKEEEKTDNESDSENVEKEDKSADNLESIIQKDSAETSSQSHKNEDQQIFDDFSNKLFE